MHQEKQKSFDEIAKKIYTDLGKLLGTRTYIGFADATGIIHYCDEDLQQFSDFIKNFVTTNFNLLNVGDHSFPLGGMNLAFFKTSQKAMIILYTKKGRSGQLLAFKAKMFEFSTVIDELIGEVAIIPPAIKIPGAVGGIESEPEIMSSEPRVKDSSRGLKTIPVLIKKLKGKEKFPLEVATVLQYCDGEHSVAEICDSTNYTRLKVDNIIREYQRKKWLEVKRVL